MIESPNLPPPPTPPSKEEVAAAVAAYHTAVSIVEDLRIQAEHGRWLEVTVGAEAYIWECVLAATEELSITATPQQIAVAQARAISKAKKHISQSCATAAPELANRLIAATIDMQRKEVATNWTRIARWPRP